jgi:hypothetical protein
MSDSRHSPSLDLSGLPPAERAKCYRELAEMHLRLGQQASADTSASHLELAALWTRLAAQAEHQASGDAAHAAGPHEDQPKANA